jgi:hypothetical protein
MIFTRSLRPLLNQFLDFAFSLFYEIGCLAFCYVRFFDSSLN